MKDKYYNYQPKRRLLAMLLLITFIFCAVAGKLAYVMIVEGEKLQTRALEQWMRDVPLQARRGAILDRNGIVLADTSTLYTVFVRPNAVRDVTATADALASVLGLDRGKILEKIKGKRVSEITILKNVSKDKMLALKDSGATGIYYSENNFRYYPYGDFMTQLLGFTNIDGDGQTGLERYYNEYLRGVNGMVLTETDLIGRELAEGSTAYLPAISGLNLVTTLDYYIQRLCERAVKAAASAFSAKSAYCIAMNPLNGEIYALAETPSFDLNNVPRNDLTALFTASKSAIVSNVYEPGSTFKILTASAALDCGAYNVNSRFYCGGSHIVDGQKIRCWKFRGHGSISYAEGVLGSCNVVFMNSAMAVGAARFYGYLSAFGAFTKTGIDMSGEASGLYIPLENVKNVDLARIGFGQAIAVTSLELVAASCAAVNGGTTVTPHLLYEISDADGRKVESFSNRVESRRVIKPSTSEIMRSLLAGVVKEGSGKASYIPGYNIMGKTGTAQKYINGIIAQGKYISSFLGIVMEENCNLAILLVVDEPQGAYYGSVVAAPLVGEIFKGALSYFGSIPHFSEGEKDTIGKPFALPSFIGMSLSEAKKALSSLGLYLETDGEGSTVTAQYPAAGTIVDKRNAVQLTLG